MRLTSGPTSNATSRLGRLEAYRSEVWAAVAGGSPDTAANISGVACRQLGFDSGQSTTAAVFQNPSLNAQWQALTCNGSEPNVASCDFGGAGIGAPLTSGGAELGLACYNASDVGEGWVPAARTSASLRAWAPAGLPAPLPRHTLSCSSAPQCTPAWRGRPWFGCATAAFPRKGASRCGTRAAGRLCAAATSSLPAQPPWSAASWACWEAPPPWRPPGGSAAWQAVRRRCSCSRVRAAPRRPANSTTAAARLA